MFANYRKTLKKSSPQFPDIDVTPDTRLSACTCTYVTPRYAPGRGFLNFSFSFSASRQTHIHTHIIYLSSKHHLCLSFAFPPLQCPFPPTTISHTCREHSSAPYWKYAEASTTTLCQKRVKERNTSRYNRTRDFTACRHKRDGGGLRRSEIKNENAAADVNKSG